MRNVPFADGEIYHIYNRGVDKRSIFIDTYDVQRFLQCMAEFNSTQPIGSIFANSFKGERAQRKKLSGKTTKCEQLVEVICYCLNPNHFHFLLQQVSDNGISEYMRKIGGGYTRYFNHRHGRSGALCQGKFKDSHISSNEYLLHISAYINLNNRVHQLSGKTTKLVRSSWREYIDAEVGNEIDRISDKEYLVCSKEVVLEQFQNTKKYEFFAKDSLKEILRRREQEKDLTELLLE